MLSGIGPADHLAYHKIQLVHNLPAVGKNMQSHVGMGELIFTVKKPVSFDVLRLSLNPVNLLNYFLTGNGPFASSSGLDAIGNIRTPYAEANTTWPDVGILFLGVHVNADGGAIFRRSLHLKDSYFKHFQSLKFQEGFTLLPVLLHPYSRGEVRLRSRNPFDKPRILPNYFQDLRDLDTLMEGIRRSFSIVQDAGIFQKFGTQFFDKVNPACKMLQAFSTGESLNTKLLLKTATDLSTPMWTPCKHKNSILGWTSL